MRSMYSALLCEPYRTSPLSRGSGSRILYIHMSAWWNLYHLWFARQIPEWPRLLHAFLFPSSFWLPPQGGRLPGSPLLSTCPALSPPVCTTMHPGLPLCSVAVNPLAWHLLALGTSWIYARESPRVGLHPQSSFEPHLEPVLLQDARNPSLRFGTGVLFLRDVLGIVVWCARTMGCIHELELFHGFSKTGTGNCPQTDAELYTLDFLS